MQITRIVGCHEEILGFETRESSTIHYVL